MLDEPTTVTYGGKLAAPVFQKVASRVLAYGGYLPGVVFATADGAPGTASSSRPARAAKPSKVKAGASPDVTGMSLRRAMERFALAGAVPEVRGDGLTVFRQQPAPGEALEKDGSPRPCIVWMSREAYEEDIRKAEQQAAAQAVETAQAAAVPAPRQEKASSVQPGKTEAEKKDSSTGSPRQKTGTGRQSAQAAARTGTSAR